jgi:alpha-beta hydrolase superfamily lysophospholipase
VAKTFVWGSIPVHSSIIDVPLFNENGISRSQRVVKDYLEDPLVYHGNVTARLGLLILRQMQILPGKLRSLQLPLLVMHGTSDLISDAKGSRLLHRKVASKDKTLYLYEGFYHDIFNDPGQERILADIEQWLSARSFVSSQERPQETKFSQSSGDKP